MVNFNRASWRFIKGFGIGFVCLELVLLAFFLLVINTDRMTIMFTSVIAVAIAIIVGAQEALGPYMTEYHDDEQDWFARCKAWFMCHSRWEMFWKTWLLSTAFIFLLCLVGLQATDVLSMLDINLGGGVVVQSVVLGAVGGALRTFKYWDKLE
ncbi:MAG: hypothetical protein HYT15_03210 [Candidatus Magasanikbacteria bacterium]|nr:hypothetical protein [Candidatus Magasanikbacteria bacterium]